MKQSMPEWRVLYVAKFSYHCILQEGLSGKSSYMLTVDVSRLQCSFLVDLDELGNEGRSEG
jgi:hypothetical protein